jgi:FkbM family methyltransferase
MRLKTKPCKHGTMTFLENDYWIGKALDQTGEYSGEEVQKLLSLIDSESIVVEVGANIGSISVPLASKAKALHAFEPQAELFDVLCRNADQNGLTGHLITAYAALGAKHGRMSCEPIDLDKEDVNSGNVSMVEGNDVPVLTLDEYCHGWPRLDLLKIDVEGGEADVIAGGTETISRLQPILYVENDRKEKSAKLIGLIQALGYKLFWHLPTLFNPNPCGEDDQFVSINMLCLPAFLREEIKVDLSDLTPIMSVNDDWRLAYQRRRLLNAPRVVHSGTKAKQWACIVRLGGVGDNLVASSVLPYLKEKYGHVEVIACDPQHVVFENNPNVDKLSVKQPGVPPWGDGKSWQAYWADRASEFAFFAHLSHTIEGFRAMNEGQTGYWWPSAARRKFCGQSYIEAVADICGVPYDRLTPGFFPTEAELADAERTKRRIGDRYVAWVISGTRLDKIWPPSGVAIARIIKELSLPVVMFGMPGKDLEIAREIERSVGAQNGSTKDLHLALSTSLDAPNWPLRRCLTQAQLADLVVSPDTGPAWAVASCDIPKVIMVSHASPENITKHWINTVTLHANAQRVPCWPCHQLHDTKEACEAEQRRCGMSPPKDSLGAACISDISVDRVIEEVRKALQPKHKASMEVLELRQAAE